MSILMLQSLLLCRKISNNQILSKMNTPLITWGCIVGLFIIILVVRLYRATTDGSKSKRKIISFMSEREEFYIPGDPDPKNADDYDFDD